MSVGHPCIHCREGRVRPFHFSLDQAILRCDNAGCDSLLDESPWERVISRNIRQQIPRRSSDFGHYRLWGGSSSSSGVQSDIRSPLLSPAQSFGSVTDKEVELLLRKSYAPPKPTKHIRRSPKKCPPVSKPTEVSSTKLLSPMLKTDPKCESFFELLNNLDLESPAHPVKKESPSASSLDDIVTAELESWMKGFESPESARSDEVTNSLHSNSTGVNSTCAEPDVLKLSGETLSDLRLPEEQRCVIPSQRSAFSQVSPKREKKVLHSYTCQDTGITSDIISKPASAFEENEDIQKILAEGVQGNCSNRDSLICTSGNCSDSVKDDLSLLCDSQFLSPAASASSDDSGYNEDDANKVAIVSLPQLQENRKLSSYSNSSFGSSGDIDVNEVAKCKSVVNSSQVKLKNLTSADLEVSAPQDIHFNIHPAMITLEKCGTVNDPPDVASGSLVSNEGGGSLPVNQSSSSDEHALIVGNEREVEASNVLSLENKIVENTPSFSRSCFIGQEDNGSCSVPRNESILRIDDGATSVINSSQTPVIHEHCEDILSVASSHSGSTLPSDIIEDDESKTLCSDQSSDGLSHCSGASINQCKGNNRGRGRGPRARSRKTGCAAGNFRSSDSNLEVSNDTQPKSRGRGRGHGRGANRGKGQGRVNVLPWPSELQPNKRPRVAAEILRRQTRQRTGSIEVQAPTAPRERLSKWTTSVDSDDGSMRRGLSSLLQSPSWQISEQKNIQHNQNFTNLSFRSLLSGSIAKDPWSVMEVYLEELDIEVVVQGIRSSPEVPSEGNSSPGTNKTTEEAGNNIQQQKHGEQLAERINEAKNELQTDKHSVGTPMLDNSCVFQVQIDAQRDVLSKKERTESEINNETSTCVSYEKGRKLNDDIHTTLISASENEKLKNMLEDSVLTMNDDKDEIHVEELRNCHSSTTSLLSLGRQDYVKIVSPVEIHGDSQRLGFAQEPQQKQTDESPLDAKTCINKPERDTPEDLEINVPHGVQNYVKPHCTQNFEASIKKQYVLPEENVQSYLKVTVSEASTKELVDNDTKSEIKDREFSMKDSQPFQASNMPDEISTHGQGCRENQVLDIGIQNEISKITDHEVSSVVVNDEKVKETTQHCFSAKGAVYDISLPSEKQIIAEKCCQIQLKAPQHDLDTKEYMKKMALELTESGQSVGMQNESFDQLVCTHNESRAIQNPSHSKELELKNKSEGSVNLMQYDTALIPQFSNAVQDLHLDCECCKSRDLDRSLQEVHVLDILEKFIQECDGSGVISRKNDGEFIKNRERKVKDSNSVIECSSSSFQDSSDATNHELKKSSTPSSESSPNASPYYLLLSPESDNVRSWMGYPEDSSLKEQVQAMPLLEDKDVQHRGFFRKNNNSESTVKGPSSKYFGSLLQDIDFDDKFFQCPVQEHPSKTFEEHISSSLFFGETASNSPPETISPESSNCVKSEIDQELNVKYKDTGYSELEENCQVNNIQASQYPVCKVSEHCAAINSVSTTSTQMNSVPLPTNIDLNPFPVKLSQTCTRIPSCSSLSHHRAEVAAHLVKFPVSGASCDYEATNLPVTQTFTSSAVFTAPKTPHPSMSYSTVCTMAVVPMVTSTCMRTVPSVMIDSGPTCSSIPVTKVDTHDKSKKKKKRMSLRRLRMNAVRQEENRNEESQIITTDTSIRKSLSKERKEIHDTSVTQDYSGATYAASIEMLRNNLSTSDQSGCDTKQGESSINLPSASVCSVVQSLDDRVVSVKMEEALHNVFGLSEAIKKNRKCVERLSKTVPSDSIYMEEPKCFQSRNNCNDEYDDDRPGGSEQLLAVDSLPVCAGEVNFIINAEKPGTSHDGDGDDDIPIISIDSEDEIQIIIPEKKCKHPKKTKDVGNGMRKVTKDGGVSDSIHGCGMQEKKNCHTNSLKGNSDILYEIRREKGITGENFCWDKTLKVEYTYPEKQTCCSNQRGQKRMVEDADGNKVIKKQRNTSDTIQKENKIGRLTEEIDSPSDDFCFERGALICGILDNSVVHDKKCFSPRVKEFLDFDENARSSDIPEKDKKFYSVSKKSDIKVCHNINAFEQLGLDVSRENEYSHILNQDNNLQRESSCHVFDAAKLCQDYKFGCTKSSPQHELHPALKSDESNPGLLELDSTEIGFLSPLITSPESCTPSPEPSQLELGSGGCNCHISVKSLEGIGSGHETSCIESRLTNGTEIGISGSESEETVQPTSDFENETSVYDGSEEESESEGEDSWKSSVAQKPMVLSNMKIQISDSEGEVLKVIPVVDSQSAHDIEQLKCVKTSHSLKPESLRDTRRPENDGNTMMLSRKYITSQSSLVPVMPLKVDVTNNSLETICSSRTSPSLASNQFSERSETKNSLRNPQTNSIQSVTAFSQGSTVEHQNQRLHVLPFVSPIGPTGVPLPRTSLSQSWGVPLKTTLVNRISNSTNVMQTHQHYFSHHEKQKSVIDYELPVSPNPLTIVPPALITSYANTLPGNTILTQAKAETHLDDSKSTYADKPQERIVALTAQTANGPVTRVLRVVTPSMEHSDHPKEQCCRKNSRDEKKNNTVESLSEQIKESCLENNMLKKVKMGSKGGYYMRPSLSLMNAISEMRRKSELDARAKENAKKNAKYVELPDGEPICHPLILPSERKGKSKSIKSKKRRKKIRGQIKRDRKTKKFVKGKVQETVERSKDNCVVPEMVVVCVGGKLHVYRRDLAETSTK
ncbi:LOW QUALITY PROTEIN: uncharacterized protein [Panulirus ornatus]|uniref:LOW QUALITY PROTEIN: uncharacterized protein n=1 Tax=Panulirus ornatus TaxID=150431 RepID=UPI003A8481F9